jgi:hypothetical protein
VKEVRNIETIRQLIDHFSYQEEEVFVVDKADFPLGKHMRRDERYLGRQPPVLEGKGKLHKKIKHLSFFFLLLVLITLLSVPVHARTVTIDVKMKRSILVKDCMECHADAIKGEEYANSVHGPNACTSCHVDIIDLAKHAEGIYIPQSIDCSTCHTKESAQYINSIHHIREQFSCVECHADIHYVTTLGG